MDYQPERELTRLTRGEARLLREAVLWSTNYGFHGDDATSLSSAQMPYDNDVLFKIVDALDATMSRWFEPGRESDPTIVGVVERVGAVLGEGKRGQAREIVLAALRVTDETTSEADLAVALQATRADLSALAQRLANDATTAAISQAWARVARECCPDTYYCPASDDIECVRHGGFSECCSRPQDHLSVGGNAGEAWSRDTAWDETHRQSLRERARALLVELVGDLGLVEAATHAQGIEAINVTPKSPSARAVWMCFEDSLICEVGEIGGRWELDYNEGSIDFLQELLESVVAGRVEEVFAPGRSQVAVTLPSGHALYETGYSGPSALLPLPFWRRWGRRVTYAAYGDPVADEPLPSGATRFPAPPQMRAVWDALATRYRVTNIADHPSGHAWFFECTGSETQVAIVSAGDEDDLVIEYQGEFWRDFAVDNYDIAALVARAVAKVDSLLRAP